MNTHRERLESSGLLPAFERARRAQDTEAMTRILETAKFRPLEIESILWSKGEVGTAPTEEEKRKQFWDAVVGRVGIAVVSGAILGGVFVYASASLDSTKRSGKSNTDVLMSDYRSPSEAYYRPFAWGFVIGAVGGLITGTLVYDPKAKKP
ncbi:MAG: hypothetical protein NTV51_10560 [Verrucomicrobia bacterium]|nr:hypothetical protein [Verrucomicrobiota bacterium]